MCWVKMYCLWNNNYKMQNAGFSRNAMKIITGIIKLKPSVFPFFPYTLCLHIASTFYLLPSAFRLLPSAFILFAPTI